MFNFYYCFFFEKNYDLIKKLFKYKKVKKHLGILVFINLMKIICYKRKYCKIKINCNSLRTLASMFNISKYVVNNLK